MKTLSPRFICLALLAAGLSACGNGSSEKSASQVVAKVGGEEITVHLVNAVLSKLSGVDPAAVGAVRKQVLENLVNQQLAVNEAQERKLDRSPDVQMALDMARREILARAYYEQIAGGVSPPGREDAHKYYMDHPALFSARKVFNVQQIDLKPEDGLEVSLRQDLAAGRSMEEVVVGLKAKSIKYSASAGAKPAEQMPMDILPKLAELKDGQSLVVASGDVLRVIRLLSSQLAPVDEAQATPIITQALLNEAKGKAVRGEIERLKSKVKVEYVGAEAPDAKVPAAENTSPKTGDAANLAKGLAGLK